MQFVRLGHHPAPTAKTQYRAAREPLGPQCAGCTHPMVQVERKRAAADGWRVTEAGYLDRATLQGGRRSRHVPGQALSGCLRSLVLKKALPHRHRQAMQVGEIMNKQNTLGSLSVLLVTSLLVACSPQAAAPAAVAGTVPAPAPVAERAAVPAPVVCSACGVVRSVTAVTQDGQASGAGAVIGGIVGGVAGNQVGGGSGRKIATVAGVIGGAVLGHKVEENRNTSTYYEVVIDMEGGGQQFLTLENAGGINP